MAHITPSITPSNGLLLSGGRLFKEGVPVWSTALYGELVFYLC